MLRALRTSLPALLALALAAASLLPPSGWALCIAPGGHVEVEPVIDAGGCCTATVPTPSAEDVAPADSDCDACTDVMAFVGPVTHGRTPELVTPPLSAPVGFTDVQTCCAARATAPGSRAPAPCPGSARRTGTLLRI